MGQQSPGSGDEREGKEQAEWDSLCVGGWIYAGRLWPAPCARGGTFTLRLEPVGSYYEKKTETKDSMWVPCCGQTESLSFSVRALIWLYFSHVTLIRLTFSVKHNSWYQPSCRHVKSRIPRCLQTSLWCRWRMHRRSPTVWEQLEATSPLLWTKYLRRNSKKTTHKVGRHYKDNKPLIWEPIFIESSTINTFGSLIKSCVSLSVC